MQSTGYSVSKTPSVGGSWGVWVHIGTSGSWTLSYSVEHLYVEFTPHKANQPLQGTELQEKEEKDDKHMKANLKEL